MCQIDGVTAGFESSQALDVSEGASIQGVPGGRRDISVAPVSEPQGAIDVDPGA